MVRAGLDKVVANTAPTSAERAMTERLGDLAADEVWRRAGTAWRRSDDGASFVAALLESGLRLAMGDKCPVLVSPAGAVHPLLRALNKGAERNAGSSVRKRDVDRRLQEVPLPPVGSIEPLEGFAAGPFAVINLDRLPVPQTREGQPVHHMEDVPASDAGQQLRPLTPQQETALLLLEDALHGTAAETARAVRAKIEAEVEMAVARRRLRDRIGAEHASWQLPSIGVAGWRDTYRAELAGLPAGYGPHLKWVEKLDADRRRVTLRSGTIITLEPQRGSTDKTGSDAVAVLIEHARVRKWPGITITGDEQWRYDAAVAATRAGLAVVDADLLPVVEAERNRMLLEDWWSFRQDFEDAPPDQRQQQIPKLLAYRETLSAAKGIRDLVPDEQQRMLDAYIAAYDRHRQARTSRFPRAGP
jgi:hypothetical protein